MSVEGYGKVYNMTHRKRGLALIFNHENFAPTLTNKKRNGTEADKKQLKKTFRKLNFDVKSYDNLTEDDLRKRLKHVSKKDHSESDCLVIIVLSHGNSDGIFAHDTNYKPELLWTYFRGDNCPSLAGKPKIFFIQACRGNEYDPGFEVETDNSSSNGYRMPNYADFLIVYSTMSGFKSWRNPINGSWFIQSLCSVLNSDAEHDDVLSMMTKVTQKVAIEFEYNAPDNENMRKLKQIPCVTSMLTKKIFFQKKISTMESFDLTFVVGEERIMAHRNILSVSSPVFHSMCKESKEQDEIRILDISPFMFRVFLGYIYTDEYPELNFENWAPLLYASKKYETTSLKNKCIEFVYNNYTCDNVCGFFNQARKHQVDHLVPRVKNAIALNAETSLTSESFLEIEDNEYLKEILSYDKLNCVEIIVFRSALAWASFQIKKRNKEEMGANIRKVLGPALYTIRFPSISRNELKNEVIPKNILTDEEIRCILNGEKDTFNCESRIRNLERFHWRDSSFILSKRHSIQFQVDCRVKIHALGIFKPCNEISLTGRMLLKDTNHLILGEKYFENDFNEEFIKSIIDFPNPIVINPNTYYTFVIEYDSMNVQVYSGKGGRPELTIHDVKWMFEDDPLSCRETGVRQGQIPMILFSKID